MLRKAVLNGKIGGLRVGSAAVLKPKQSFCGQTIQVLWDWIAEPETRYFRLSASCRTHWEPKTGWMYRPDETDALGVNPNVPATVDKLCPYAVNLVEPPNLGRRDCAILRLQSPAVFTSPVVQPVKALGRYLSFLRRAQRGYYVRHDITRIL